MISINNAGLPVPVSTRFASYLTKLLKVYPLTNNVIINFRDPRYSPDEGGYHPVEIRLEIKNNFYQLSYITDFCYVGNSFSAELVKELDFNFEAGILQTKHNTYPIEQAREVYTLWESNFLEYAETYRVFEIKVTPDY